MSDLRGQMAPPRARLGFVGKIIGDLVVLAGVAAAVSFIMQIPPQPRVYSAVANNRPPAPTPPGLAH